MIKRYLKLSLLIILSAFLSACSTLTYTGEDYVSDNVQTIKTNEDFLFNTYKKSLSNANIKMGITRTSVQEILALYIQIENLSYDTPYIFKVEDLRLSNPRQDVQFITSNNYLSIYQNQEASSMMAMNSLGATLSNMTGINSGYNEVNQTLNQNTSDQTNKSVYAKMEQLGNQILKHSVRYSSTISPRRSQYFYFFFEDNDEFPITARYKGLTYQFKL